MKIWETRANLGTGNSGSLLQQVLDPGDQIGLKNSYLDYYFKFYIRKYVLSRVQAKAFLEIGCGNGRITEFIAHSGQKIYGTDLIDDFVDFCLKNPLKSPLSNYLYLKDLAHALPTLPIELAFTLGVWMYIEDDTSLSTVISNYLNQLPQLKQAIFIEQIKSVRSTETIDQDFYCQYRTLKEYIGIFEKAGLKVEKIHWMGERKYAWAKRFFGSRAYSGFKHIPNDVYPFVSSALFHLDHSLMKREICRIPADYQEPTDVIFITSPLK